MKTIRPYILLLGMATFPVASHAQIANNDASMYVLAVQCAVSSGFSASEYEDYGRRLAKTLSLLSSAQQTRVFGYLPMPGGPRWVTPRRRRGHLLARRREAHKRLPRRRGETILAQRKLRLLQLKPSRTVSWTWWGASTACLMARLRVPTDRQHLHWFRWR
jgi:uncharacterized protein (DUF58 family)